MEVDKENTLPGHNAAAGADVLMPLDDAARVLSQQYWDSRGRESAIAAVWATSLFGPGAAPLDWPSDDECLEVAIRETSNAIQLAVDSLLAAESLTLFSPFTLLPTNDARGAMISSGELFRLMREGAHLRAASATSPVRAGSSQAAQDHTGASETKATGANEVRELEWVDLARRYADEAWHTRSPNTNPSKEDVAAIVAKRFAKEEIYSKRGLLSASTILREALSGSDWTKTTKPK
jgi:hypothetical protein